SELDTLRIENAELRARLDELERRAGQMRAARFRVLREGWGFLVPLLDRQKVVRSFGELTEKAARFAGPRSDWPAQEELITAADVFLKSCVRFMIRRRTIVLLFSLLATLIPAIQIWLVVQQNRIIDNQNEFFEIQVYDVVSRSMTEGDRNARQMTGALLANAKLDFLSDVVTEAFEPSLSGVYRSEGVHAAKRRLEDAAFRGHLVRAVARGMENRGALGEQSPKELYAQAQPMFRQVTADSVDRLPEVLRVGREAPAVDEDLAEQVDHYVAQIGHFLRVYHRLAKAAGKEQDFFEAMTPLLRRLGASRAATEGRFSPVYRATLEELLIELAIDPDFGARAPRLSDRGLSPEVALRNGLARLRQGVANEDLPWDALAAQAGVR
ncbi:MAG: hypothetical protein H5U40_15880, partial [Polyangiaceae bacterium]|nr:hypothetical protein [Polyangiaceae bacterium]